MNDEIAAYVESIDKRFALLRACIDGMTAEELNRRPPVEGGNSAWALATHVAGNARAWILGIVCGQALGRDRPGEFASRGGDPAVLGAHIDRTRDEVLAALRALPPERLDVRLMPAAELWGEGAPREISVRDGVLQVIEHASLHLGHIELTRDLVRRRG